MAASPEPPKLTPYQGKKRCFGEFRCSQCNRMWLSAFSWANFGQECKTCIINVYPIRQFPLHKPNKKTSKIDPKKKHLQELCEKCKEFGCYCCKVPENEEAQPGRRRRRRRR